MSPSSRRAWIEIISFRVGFGSKWSPSSRRAWIEITEPLPQQSADLVALLAEGVDRNSVVLSMSTMHSQSPSSRRAWIEIVTS